MKRTEGLRSVLSGGLAALWLASIGASSAQAASGTWYGTLNSVWATTNNWNSTNTVPGTGNTATFNNAGNGNTTLDLGAGVTNARLLFDTVGVGAYTIGSGAVGSQTLTLNDGGGITLNGAVTNNQLVNALVNLGTATVGSYGLTNLSPSATLTLAGTVQGGTGGGQAAKTLFVGGSGNATLAGVLANGGASSVALTKGGAGTLVLTNVNTYSGNTTLGGGVLRADYGTGLPSLTGVLYLQGGGVLETAAGALSRTIGTAAGNISFGTGGGGFAARGAPLAVSLNAAGSALTFGSANYPPNLMVLGSASADSVLTLSNTLAIANNVACAVRVLHNPSLASPAVDKVVLVGALTYTSGNGNNHWLKYGSGRLEVLGAPGAMNNTCYIILGGGTLALTGDLTSLSGFKGVLLGGGELEVPGMVTNTTRAIAILGVSNGSDAGGNAAYAEYGGAGTVTILPGSGVGARLTATSASRSPGGTVLLRGTSLGTAAYPSANVANLYVTPSAGLNLTGGGGGPGTPTISIVPYAIGDNSATGPGTDFVTHSNNGVRLLTAGEYDTSITDGTSASNNVSLTSVQNVNAATMINALRLDSGGGVAGSAALTLNSGAILALTGNAGLGGSTLAFGAKEAVFHTVGDLSVSSTLTGSAGLTKAGAGTLTLAGPNAITGTNTVNAGRLVAGAANAFGSGALKLQLNAAADLAGNSQSIAALLGISTAGLTNSGASTTLTLNTPLDTTLGPAIAGSLDLVKTGTAVFAVGYGSNLRYSGNTQIDGGVFRLDHNSGDTGISSYSLPGTVTLNGGTLRFNHTGAGHYNPVFTFTSPIQVTANGGTIDFASAANGFTITMPALTLGGNLAVSGITGNTGVTFDFLSPITLTANVTITNATGPSNAHTVNLSPNMAGATRTLTLARAGSGTGFQIAGITATSLNLGGLVVATNVSLYLQAASTVNPTAQIKANGGVVTMAAGSSLTLQGSNAQPGPVFDPSAVVWQGSNTMTIMRDSGGNSETSVQIATNLLIGAAGGPTQLTAYISRGIYSNAPLCSIVVSNGGTLSVYVHNDGSYGTVAGDIKLLDGATLGGSSASGKQGGLIRGTSGALRLGDGSGTPSNPSVITIRGDHGAGVNTFKIGYPTNTFESGTVRLRYVSTSATAGSTFNVGWSAGGQFDANLLAFRTTSGGTEFAPLAGGGGIAVVGTNSGRVAVFSNAVTLITGGTVGFYNAGANNTRGSFGTVVVTNGGVFGISNGFGRVVATNIVVSGGTVGGIGTFAPVNMAFTNAATYSVVLTGGQPTNCGLLAVSNALTFAPDSQVTVDTNAYAPSALQYWYIASAAAFDGLPSVPSGFSLAVEGTQLKLTKLSSGTAPSIENRAPTNVAATSATMCGYLNSTGTAPTTVSVYWGTTDGGAAAAAWANTNTFQAPASPGPFATNVTLVQDQPYYYRYAAANTGGEDWPTQAEHFITGTILVSGTQNAGESGPVTGLFTFTRSPLLTNETLLIRYALSGTASNGVDYALLGGTVTMPAGSTNATISVIPVNDAMIEGSETVTVTVLEGRYVVGSPASASIELQDYVARNLVWTDASGSHKWNSSDANWTDGAPQAFTDGDRVTFDDSAANRTVALVATVQPSVVTFLNTSAATYRLTNGVLAGASAVTVGGGGTVKLGVDGVETTTPQAPVMTYSGGTVISNNSLVKYSCGSATPTNALGGGSVTLNGGRLNLNFSGSLNGGSMWLSNPLAVGTLGGTLDLTPDGGGNNRRPYWYFPGGAALGGLLTVYWDGTSQGSINTPTFSGVVSLTSDTTISNGIVNPAAAVTLTALSGAARTLTLAGAGGFALPTTAAKLNLQNVICNAGLTLSDSGATGADPLTTLKANGGLLTMGPGTTLSFLGLYSAPGQTINPAEVAWQGSNTLDLPIVVGGNGDSYWRITSNLVVSTASGLTRVNSRPFRGYMTVDAPYALMVGAGGTYSLDISSGQFNEYLNGNLTLLDGATVLGANTAVGGMIRGTSGTLTLGDGSGTPASPSVVTVQGNHGSGYNTFNLGYHRTNTTESGTVRMKYASTSATGGSYFNVGWSGGGAYNAALEAFRTTSGGTEFAPLAGGAGVAVVGPGSGTVATFTNGATVTTAGTVGFYNADPNNTRGAFGPVVVTNAGSLSFTTNGIVRASDVTFDSTATWGVTLTGPGTNDCGQIRPTGAVTLLGRPSLQVTATPAATGRGPWYIATAGSIVGSAPRVTGNASFTALVEGNRILLRPLPRGAVFMVR